MCTRILWNSNKLAVVTGRTMDWPTTTEPMLTVLPRGMERDGGRFATQLVVADNPARWISKYGSVVVTTYGIGSVDGLNERGCAAHLLYLDATDFGVRDSHKQGVQAGLWAQYILDNAENVQEALQIMDRVQPIMVAVHDFKSTLHMALEDADGDSAILEYVGGELTVHHGRQYRVMTNDPTYEQQLANRAHFDFSNATRQTPLPGNVDPLQRFVRADYFLQFLPEPRNEREAIASILSIARNVSVPFGAPKTKPGSLYNTEYRTAMDLTNRRYFFELTTAPNVIWLELDKLNFTQGAPVMMLNPDDINLSGEVSECFAAAAQIPF